MPEVTVERPRRTLGSQAEHGRERLDEEVQAHTTADAYRQLRIDVIAVETAELRRLYDINRISDTTRRRIQRRLDLEEARLGEGRPRPSPQPSPRPGTPDP